MSNGVTNFGGIAGGALRSQHDVIYHVHDYFSFDEDHIVAITLRYFNSKEVVVEDSFRHYINMVSRNIYGNQHTRKGKVIKHFAVTEKDNEHRFHSHATIAVRKDITSLDEFKETLNLCYLKHRNRMRSKNGIKIEEVYSDGWNTYICKLRSKEDGFLAAIDPSTFRSAIG